MLRSKRSGKQEGSSFKETGASRSGKDEGGGSGGGDELLRMSALASLSGDSATGNVDPRLIDDLQDLLPLLESFLDRDRKVSSCFTRRGKMVCTKTPSKDSLSMKKGRRASQSVPGKEHRILGEKDRSEYCSKDRDDGDSSSLLSQNALEAEKDREEIKALNDQLEDLRRKLLEKEELLSAAEISGNQLTSAQEKLNELQYQMREKDSMLKAFERQLSDTKIKLAERQAALEKIQWEAVTSNKQVEKLQEDLKTAELEMSAFTILLEGSIKNDNSIYTVDYDLTPHWTNHGSEIVNDDIDELDLQKMEEARKVYLAAVAAAKECQDEESLAAVASARFHLQSFILAF
uniref:Uncharacterized protein n=1 Tax=Kalanchoe fedtschenkoi TaxID=63787 RepID=A0A7N0T173_KALFE